MAATDCKPCQVVGLYHIVDLSKVSSQERVRLSEETNDDILLYVLRRLGPKRALKAVDRLIEDGYLPRDVNEYEVEKILDKKYCPEKECEVFLVKWKHWPHSYNTWEPIKNLEGCDDALEEFATEQQNGDSFSPHQLKRKLSDDSDSDSSYDEYTDEQERQIKEVFKKLKKYEMITAWTLLNLSECNEIVRNGGRVKLKPFLSRKRLAWATKKRSKVYKEHKLSLKETLSSWERKFNAVYPNSQPIKVENEVDLEAPPENFKFINDYLLMEGLTLEKMPIIGCTCETRCSASTKVCCAHNNDAYFAYTKAKKVRLVPGSAIYECSSQCKCGPDCWNRVVQLGSQVKVALFKTKNGCGWGVKSNQKIKKGTFIMEYLGEIITNEEAERRGQIYDTEGFTYLFDLDFHGDDCQFTIDARYYGNISHFVNHSCDPNMSVYGVFIDNIDVRLPRIALFANRNIKAGEELTFDYKMTGDTSEVNRHTDVTTPVKVSPFKPSPGQRSAVMTNDFTESSDGSSSGCHSSFITPPSSSEDEFFTDAMSPKQFYSKDKKQMLKDKTNLTDAIEMEKRDYNELDLDEISSTTTDYQFPIEKPQNQKSDQSDENSSTNTQSTTFSCQNYRIVCHCGAKNCRKFLF